MLPQADPAARRAAAPLLRVLAGERVNPPPVWLMRQAGRYLPEYRRLREQAGDFLNLCLRPEYAAEATLQPVRRFGVDAAILFADILLVPHALGQRVAYVDGAGPRLTPLASPRAVDRLATDADAAVDAALAPVQATLAAVRPRLPAAVALIGFAGSPWTVATYMLGGGHGLDAALGWLARDPDGVEHLSRRLEAATSRYLCRQVEAGADALQLFDSWAGSLPAADFHRFSTAPNRRIVDAVRARHPQVPIIGFPRGASREAYLGFARDSRVTALALDPEVDTDWAARVLQPRLPLQGNLDPDLLAPGRDGLVAAIRRIRRTLGRGPHVFNLGHGIRPDADPGRVAQLVATLRETEGNGG